MHDELNRLLAEALDDLSLAHAKLIERGLEPIGHIGVPASPAELRCDYFFYVGKVEALQDLKDNTAEDERAA